MSLQEKFQTILPAAPLEDDGTEWTELSRSLKAKQSPDGAFNQMPELNIQTKTPFVRVLSGETDATNDVTPQAMEKGYTYRPMSPSDDQYTGEHAEHFYGEAVDENGMVGFTERNNYLDRM